MAFEQKDNSGALFKNEKRTEQNNQPNARGSALITCPHCGRSAPHRVSAWTKTAKSSGDKFQSLKFEPDTKAGAPSGPTTPTTPSMKPAPRDVPDPIGDEQFFAEDEVPF